MTGFRRMVCAGAVASLLVATLAPTTVNAAGPITSSTFDGAENPLNENGAWVPIYSMSFDHVQFQKNNGAAYPGSFNGAHNNHPAARTTTPLPADQYSEIVVGHIETNKSYVGAMVRVQTSGPAVDSHYTWWASLAGGENLELYRFDRCDCETLYVAQRLTPNTPVADGDRLRLIARGPVLYGIKNGVRDFIYNTGKDSVRYDSGSTGILAFAAGPTLTDATIASWSTGAAPTSSGTWASSTFDGPAENPLDEQDRWYPLPGSGVFNFTKDGGVAKTNSPYEMGILAGAWDITPPPTQYSEVTLGEIAGSGGGAVVRIDRTSNGPTGWLLFLWADSARDGSGIYKINPVGETITMVRPFRPTVAPGDKWRLAADGDVLEVFKNGVSQFTYTTDGSYPTGDVGIQAYSSAFTFDAWEGGETTPPPPPPTIASFAPTSAPVGTSVQINGANFNGASAVTFNGSSASFSVTSATAIRATVPTGATTGPISVTTPGGTANGASNFTVTASPPTITSFSPTSGAVGASVQINGSTFSGASAVTFNGVNASFSVTSATVIQTSVPAGAITGPIRVTTPAGTGSSTTNFTVTAGPPTITSFAPASGRVGTSLQINGTNFAGASKVAFNGATASFTVTSPTTIQTTVPAAATTGSISVTTPGGTATSANKFTVMAPLTVTKTSPLGVGRGTVVSTSNPASANQIDCGPNCSVDFISGTVVTLTATPALLSLFEGWTGCDSVNGTTCTVTVNSARTVTARFLP